MFAKSHSISEKSILWREVRVLEKEFAVFLLVEGLKGLKEDLNFFFTSLFSFNNSSWQNL
jgi:hypothetical protein